MILKFPTDAKGWILHLWKYISSIRINEDKLYSIMAFELKLGSMGSCKKIIQQFIDQGFVIEYTETEEIALNDDLKMEYQKWENEGQTQAEIMRKLLQSHWREDLVLSDKFIYEVLERDLVDYMVEQNALKMRASAVKITKTDFEQEIIGTIQGSPDSPSIDFRIDCDARRIFHSCPEYDSLRKEQKKFCVHLARVLMKLFFLDKINTLELLKDLVHNRELWTF